MDAGANVLARKTLLFFGGGAALLLLGTFTFFAPAEPEPSIVVGTYVSDCCGSLSFSKEAIELDGTTFSYTLGRDNSGLYALPEISIGIVDGRRLVVDPSQQALKLRFEPADEPQLVTLQDPDERGSYYEFFRQ